MRKLALHAQRDTNQRSPSSTNSTPTAIFPLWFSTHTPFQLYEHYQDGRAMPQTQTMHDSDGWPSLQESHSTLSNPREELLSPRTSCCVVAKFCHRGKT